MIEGGETNHTEHFRIVPDMLPTSPEIAREGTETFKKVLSETRSPEVRQALLRHAKLQSCFLGIAPQIAIDEQDSISELTPPDYEEFARVMHEYAPDIAPVLSEVTDEKGTKSISASLINLKAAEQVIRNNPDVFPITAKAEPAVWLMNTPDEWQRPGGSVDQDRRHKLLSGVPGWAIEKFQESDIITETLSNKKSTLDEDINLIAAISLSETELPQEAKEKISERIRAQYPEVSGGVLELFLRRRSYRNELGNSFVGFEPEKDTAYLAALNKLYQQSGMKELVHTQIKERWGRKLWQKIKNR